jgi:hypothetical protein
MASEAGRRGWLDLTIEEGNLGFGIYLYEMKIVIGPCLGPAAWA